MERFQHTASCSLMLHKHRKMTVPAPGDLQGKEKETSRYIRAQGSDIRVFLWVLWDSCTAHQRPQTGHFSLINEHTAAIAQLFNILPTPTSENFHPKGEISCLSRLVQDTQHKRQSVWSCAWVFLFLLFISSCKNTSSLLWCTGLSFGWWEDEQQVTVVWLLSIIPSWPEASDYKSIVSKLSPLSLQQRSPIRYSTIFRFLLFK